MTKRTKARLKINDVLRGKRTNFRAVGCLLFKEENPETKQTSYWEEWELTGLENYDSWVEYDHDSKVVSLYEPVRFAQRLEPEHLAAGNEFSITLEDGTVQTITVAEAGEGTIMAIHGKNAYQVFEGEPMAYASLYYTDAETGATTTYTVEKYNRREYDVYRKTPLSDAQQKELFGRLIRPRNWPLFWRWVMIISFVGALLFAIYDEFFGHDDSHGSGTYHGRSVYGGGSGGVGK